MKQIGLLGYGRFGKVLHSILKDDFDVLIYDPKHNQKDNFTSEENIFKLDTIFYALPISAFENALKSHLKYLNEKTEPKLLIDVLSVKLYPKQIFEKHLPRHINALLTHPLFGPDSIKSNGLAHQPIMIDQFRATNEQYMFWKNYFQNKKLHVLEMTADAHDKSAAYSQGLAHFFGRVLDVFGIQETPLDTIGAKKLFDVKEQACNDSWQLFTDLQQKNPYTKEMRIKLGKAYREVYEKLETKEENK